MGYVRNPKNKGELGLNEADAKTVRLIFDLFLKEESLRKTCVVLTGLGVHRNAFTTKHGIDRGGKPFTIDSLRTVLTCIAYLGIRPALKEGELVMVEAKWPSLIEQETFDKVQSRLVLNKNRYKPDTWKKCPFPLTEMINCGECGRHMGGKSGTGRSEKHFYYGHAQEKDPMKRISEIKCQLRNI
jgi:hypothetical protein